VSSPPTHPGQPLDRLRVPLEDLPEALQIPTLAQANAGAATGSFTTTIRPPGSKSITNRALLLAALADGTSTLTRPLADADDAQRMLKAIQELGAQVSRDEHTIRITGTAGNWPITQPTTINLNNAGTATRFLAASSILSGQPLTVDGNARMRERPIADLVKALAQLGVHATYTLTEGCPPVTLEPPASLPDHPTISFARLQSSQFVSALMLIAPHLPNGMAIEFDQPPPSTPYIDMTAQMLRRLDVRVDQAPDRSTITVARAPIAGFNLDIEPDASGATYFWTAAAITPGATATVPGLNDSIQGDARYVDLLERMGATVTHTDQGISVTGPDQLRAINADLTDVPDTAMSLAIACCFADGPSTLTGLRTLRVKETDRIEAMHTELTKLGIRINVGNTTDPDAFTIDPAGFKAPFENAHPIAFDTYDDHRMAMSLALIGLHRPNTTINDPACVRKTYPDYFQDLARIYTD